jgi:hypothetical protein
MDKVVVEEIKKGIFFIKKKSQKSSRVGDCRRYISYQNCKKMC